MKVLLHTCCGVCAAHCATHLLEDNYLVTLFFSNANIAPASEFAQRCECVEQVAAKLGIPLIIDEPDHNEWLKRVAEGYESEPEQGLRCQRCFHYNLNRTYKRMIAEKMDFFTTTLTVSPHKHSATIFKIGVELDMERFLPINFKKGDGFKKSLNLAKNWQLYRQNYCGCELSIPQPVNRQAALQHSDQQLLYDAEPLL